MKTFNASDLSHKRAEVMKAAREDGAIIQEKRTNGEVIQEYALLDLVKLKSMIERLDEMCSDDIYKYCDRPISKEVDKMLNELDGGE